MNQLKIGEIAKSTGLSVETIRYYEKRGLLPSPNRSANGYRLYPADTLDRLHFIKRCKELGFSLKEISELLSLQLSETTPASEVKQRVESKRRLIQDKICELQRLEATLQQITDLCCGEGTISECPIIEFLNQK